MVPRTYAFTSASLREETPTELSDEFRQELNAIRKEFDNGTFEEFDLRPCGVNDLMAMMKAQERATRRINGDLKIRYDVNTPSLIRYHSQNLNGLVCTVSAQEIARLVNQDQTAAIFDLNLRRFLGSGGAVNKGILTACADVTSSYEFWFLNNGITIVCDSCDPVTDPDDAHVKLKKMQIVNGCQTAATLAKAKREGKLAPDVRVLVRIYETADSDLVNRIVLTTNNQNRITSRDLRVNDSVQHLIAALLCRQAHSWLRRSVYRQSQEDVTRILAKRGGFHVARIAAHLWRKGDEWNVDASELEEQLEALEKTEGHLDASFDQAFRKLEVVVRENELYSADIDRALKSAGLDEAIQKELSGNAKGRSNKAAAADRGHRVVRGRRGRSRSGRRR